MDTKIGIIICVMYAVVCSVLTVVVLYVSQLTAVLAVGFHLKLLGLLTLCQFLFIRFLFLIASWQKP